MKKKLLTRKGTALRWSMIALILGGLAWMLLPWNPTPEAAHRQELGYRQAGEAEIVWETPQKRFWQKTPPVIRFIKDLVFILAVYFFGFMLLPVFLPFNVVKGVLNMAFTLMLYAPIIFSLRKAGLVERSASGSKKSLNLGVYLVGLLMLATGILAVLVLKHVLSLCLK